MRLRNPAYQFSRVLMALFIVWYCLTTIWNGPAGSSSRYKRKKSGLESPRSNPMWRYFKWRHNNINSIKYHNKTEIDLTWLKMVSSISIWKVFSSYLTTNSCLFSDLKICLNFKENQTSLKTTTVKQQQQQLKQKLKSKKGNFLSFSCISGESNAKCGSRH